MLGNTTQSLFKASVFNRATGFGGPLRSPAEYFASPEIRAELAVKAGVDPVKLPPLRYVMKRIPRIRDTGNPPRVRFTSG